MAIYRDTDHAVASAISTGSVGTPKPADWQNAYGAGFVESLTKRKQETIALSREERLAQAAMTAAKIHKETSDIQWCAFLAKYSQHDPERVEAVRKLAEQVKSDMPWHFKLFAVCCWASIAVRRRVTEKIMCMDSEKSRATLFRRRGEIYKQLRELEWSALRQLGLPLTDDGLFDDAVPE